MKNYTIVISLLLLAQVICHAQKEYTLENLEKASQEELDIYLNKAMKLQKSGKIVTIVGGSILGATAITVAAIAIADNGDWALGAAAIGFLGGLAGIGTMAVGIPMKSTGKKRVERINSIKKPAVNNININLKPCMQYNFSAQNCQAGFAVRINF